MTKFTVSLCLVVALFKIFATGLKNSPPLEVFKSRSLVMRYRRASYIDVSASYDTFIYLDCIHDKFDEQHMECRVNVWKASNPDYGERLQVKIPIPSFVVVSSKNTTGIFRVGFEDGGGDNVSINSTPSLMHINMNKRLDCSLSNDMSLKNMTFLHDIAPSPVMRRGSDGSFEVLAKILYPHGETGLLGVTFDKDGIIIFINVLPLHCLDNNTRLHPSEDRNYFALSFRPNGDLQLTKMLQKKIDNAKRVYHILEKKVKEFKISDKQYDVNDVMVNGKYFVICWSGANASQGCDVYGPKYYRKYELTRNVSGYHKFAYRSNSLYFWKLDTVRRKHFLYWLGKEDVTYLRSSLIQAYTDETVEYEHQTIEKCDDFSQMIYEKIMPNSAVKFIYLNYCCKAVREIRCYSRRVEM